MFVWLHFFCVCVYLIPGTWYDGIFFFIWYLCEVSSQILREHIRYIQKTALHLQTARIRVVWRSYILTEVPDGYVCEFCTRTLTRTQFF